MGHTVGSTHASALEDSLAGVSRETVKVSKRSWRFWVGHLFSEDDHSHRAPPYWNIMKETFYLERTEL